MFQYVTRTSYVWLEVGILSLNNLRYISVNQLFEKLGEKLCMALPGYNAFTRSDYTASFNRKGKVKPFELLEKNENLQEVLSNFETGDTIGQNVIDITEILRLRYVWQEESASCLRSLSSHVSR